MEHWQKNLTSLFGVDFDCMFCEFWSWNPFNNGVFLVEFVGTNQKWHARAGEQRVGFTVHPTKHSFFLVWHLKDLIAFALTEDICTILGPCWDFLYFWSFLLFAHLFQSFSNLVGFCQIAPSSSVSVGNFQKRRRYSFPGNQSFLHHLLCAACYECCIQGTPVHKVSDLFPQNIAEVRWHILHVPAQDLDLPRLPWPHWKKGSASTCHLAVFRLTQSSLCIEGNSVAFHLSSSSRPLGFRAKEDGMQFWRDCSLALISLIWPAETLTALSPLVQMSRSLLITLRQAWCM